MKKIIYSIILITCAAHAGDFDGALDTSFGTDGRVLFNFGALDMDAESNSVVVRYDGKVVTGGEVASDEVAADLALAIFNSDGTIESSNQLHIGPDKSRDRIAGLAVQPDNKVVAVGQSQASGVSQFFIARFEQDGSIDTSFNPGGAVPGVVFIDFFSTPMISVDAFATAVAFKRDGRIVAVGSAQDISQLPDNENFFYAVTVLNQDGTLDSGFANGAGRTVYSNIAPMGGVENTSSSAFSVAIQSDGDDDKIVFAGVGDQGVDAARFQIVRLTCDGDLDNTFNGNAVDQVIFNDETSEEAFGVDIYPDGKIVAVGTSNAPDAEIVVTRRLANGGADTTFNAGGAVPGQQVFAQPGNHLEAAGINIQNDEKILIVGQQASDTLNFILVRFNIDGTLDTTFGDGDGFVTTDFGKDDIADALALQADGKVVLAGSAELMGSDQVALARYLNQNDADEVFVEPTIEMPEKLTNCDENPPTLSGAAQNPSNITVYINGDEAGRVITTNDQNSWEFTPNAPLSDGPNTFQIVAEYKSGNMNALSEPSCCAIGLGPQSCISEAIREKYCPSCTDFPICS